jgi:hypothetical protein
MPDKYGLTPPPVPQGYPGMAFNYDPSLLAQPGAQMPNIPQAASMAAQAQQAQDQPPPVETQDDDTSQQQNGPGNMPLWEQTLNRIMAPDASEPQDLPTQMKNMGYAGFPEKPKSVYTGEYTKALQQEALNRVSKFSNAAADFEQAYSHPHKMAEAVGAILKSRRGAIAPLIGGLIQAGATKDLTDAKQRMEFAKGGLEPLSNALSKVSDDEQKRYTAEVNAFKTVQEVKKSIQDAQTAAAKVAMEGPTKEALKLKALADAKAAAALGKLRNTTNEWLGPKSFAQIENNVAGAGKKIAETSVIPGNAQANQFSKIASGTAALANAVTAKNREEAYKGHLGVLNDHLAFLNKHIDKMDDMSYIQHINELLRGEGEAETIYSLLEPEAKKQFQPQLYGVNKLLGEMLKKRPLPAPTPGSPAPPPGVAVPQIPGTNPPATAPTLQAQPGTLVSPPAAQAVNAQPQLQSQQAKSAQAPKLPPNIGELKARARQGDRAALAELMILVKQMEPSIDQAQPEEQQTKNPED